MTAIPDDIAGTTALVTGASRGLGRGVAIALVKAGARVVGVSRTRPEDPHGQLGAAFVPVTADAADAAVAGELIDRYSPRTLVLGAGASPLMRPVQHHTWDTFRRTWEVDVQHVFHWVREALLRPLEPGSRVIAMSSGAAVAGSPLSGGYAGAKAMIRFLAGYAAAESERDGLGIGFTALLPKLTPSTDLGASAVAAYARRQGVDVPAFLDGFGPTLSPERVGEAVLELTSTNRALEPAYLLTAADGLTPVR